MLGTPEAVLDAREAILDQYRKGELAPAVTAEQLLAADPQYAIGWHLLAKTPKDAGDSAGAEEALWRAISAGPSETAPYFTLSNLRLDAGDKAGAIPFRLIALWTVATSAVVPDGFADLFQQFGDKISRSPAAYAAVAEAVQSEMGAASWPERLVPYRLLCEIRRQTEAGLDPDLVREVLANTGCAPVFRAALREWSDGAETAVSDETAALLLALLGETEGPEYLDDLIDDRQYPTGDTLLHAEWAIRRIAQRHAAEAFHLLEAAVPKADANGRCFIAEQIYFLPAEVPGRKEAILRILDDLPSGEDPESAAHLLLTVSTLMAMLGSPVDSHAVLEKHRRRVPKEGRRWLEGTLASDPDWLPVLSSESIDELTIDDVCADLALTDQPEGHAHDDEEGYEDEDYEDAAAPAPRPGRNDPCWCGSGKKYKKCHLEADEEEHRAGSSGGESVIQNVLDEVMQIASQTVRHSDMEIAHRRFFGSDPEQVHFDQHEQTAFYQWLALDFRPAASGRTAVEEFLRRRGERLPGAERQIAEAFRDARYGLWEVRRVEKGRGLELEDRFGGGCMFVEDAPASRRSKNGDLILAYTFGREGYREFFGDGFRISPEAASRIAAMVAVGAGEAGVPPSAYLRSRSGEWWRIARQEDVGRS